MKSLFTSVCLAACVGLAVSSTATAHPTVDPDITVSRIVRLGDVDLHTQAGAKVAAWRIHRAADFVCGGDNALRRQAADFPDCRNHAIDRALDTLQAPLVSAALGRQTPAGLADVR